MRPGINCVWMRWGQGSPWGISDIRSGINCVWMRRGQGSTVYEWGEARDQLCMYEERSGITLMYKWCKERDPLSTNGMRPGIHWCTHRSCIDSNVSVKYLPSSEVYPMQYDPKQGTSMEENSMTWEEPNPLGIGSSHRTVRFKINVLTDGSFITLFG